MKPCNMKLTDKSCPFALFITITSANLIPSDLVQQMSNMKYHQQMFYSSEELLFHKIYGSQNEMLRYLEMGSCKVKKTHT